MKDPLERATSRAPATLGEGCVRRYDPEALDDNDGTDFPGAARLWRELQESERPDEAAGEQPPAE